jgi:hypothetical protein
LNNNLRGVSSTSKVYQYKDDCDISSDDPRNFDLHGYDSAPSTEVPSIIPHEGWQTSRTEESQNYSKDITSYTIQKLCPTDIKSPLKSLPYHPFRQHFNAFEKNTDCHDDNRDDVTESIKGVESAMDLFNDMSTMYEDPDSMKKNQKFSDDAPISSTKSLISNDKVKKSNITEKSFTIISPKKLQSKLGIGELKPHHPREFAMRAEQKLSPTQLSNPLSRLIRSNSYNT